MAGYRRHTCGNGTTQCLYCDRACGRDVHPMQRKMLHERINLDSCLYSGCHLVLVHLKHLRMTHHMRFSECQRSATLRPADEAYGKQESSYSLTLLRRRQLIMHSSFFATGAQLCRAPAALHFLCVLTNSITSS